jgi:hypothetical protein
MKRSILAFLCAATLAASSTGCYGSFAATRKIHSWNGTVTGNKYANSVIMWGLIIIPVYELGTLVDVLVLNPLEIISGSN